MNLDKSILADACRFQWLLNSNGYFMEEQFLCGHDDTTEEEQDNARKIIDRKMNEPKN